MMMMMMLMIMTRMKVKMMASHQFLSSFGIKLPSSSLLQDEDDEDIGDDDEDIGDDDQADDDKCRSSPCS